MVLLIGKRSPQYSLYDVGALDNVKLPPGSFYFQLAQNSDIFDKINLSVLYVEDNGRPSIPPPTMCLLLVLQMYDRCSDQEAIDRATYDARWVAVLRGQLGQAPCVKSTLCRFRSLLVLKKAGLEIFQKTLREAREQGRLGKGRVRLLVDTFPITGRGAAQDTFHLIAQAMSDLIRIVAKREGVSPEHWADQHDLRRYLTGGPVSLKATAEIDWSVPEQREAWLRGIIQDFERLHRKCGELQEQLPEEEGAALREAMGRANDLVGQDVATETDTEGQVTKAEVIQGVSPDRMPSATDPDQRHGRKSASQTFKGHKGRLMVDEDSQMILAVETLAGNAGDAEDLLDSVKEVAARTPEGIEDVCGDCAMGNGATRQAFSEEGIALAAKVPSESRPGGRIPKSQFQIDLVQMQVTCPAGRVARTYQTGKDGGHVFKFLEQCRNCPQRASCTSSPNGRTIQVHPQEQLLQQARKYQATPEGRARLRRRVTVEHTIARMARLGSKQARYKGRAKTHLQLILAATVCNLRLLWNWKAAQEAEKQAQTAQNGVHKAIQCVILATWAIIRCDFGAGADPRPKRGLSRFLIGAKTVGPGWAPS